MGKTVSLNKITVLAIVSFLSITLITFFKSALELEDAEQAYYSQWLRWGYDDQPPLYTWLQYILNIIFGTAKLSFSLLRGVLFASTLLLLYRFSKERIKDIDKANLSVLILVLVPVYIDFTFRRLSHTSLLCLCIVASYYCIQLLLQRKSLFNYLLFGVVVSIGIMSKYNYAFFLVTFALVSLWDKEMRNVLLNKKMLISILLTIVIVSPHLYWLLGPDGFQSFLESSIQEKIGAETESKEFSLLPIAIYLKGVFALSFPIVALLILGVLLKKISFSKNKLHWFSKMFFMQLLVLGIFFLVFQSQKVETRWLLPLFIPFVVLLLETVSFKNNRKMVNVGYIVFLAVILLQTLRTPAEKLLNIQSSVHFGFEPIANKLVRDYEEYQWVLPNVTYAGNVRLLHSDRTIFSADDYSLKDSESITKKRIEVTIHPSEENNRTPVDSLVNFGKHMENLYFYID